MRNSWRAQETKGVTVEEDKGSSSMLYYIMERGCNVENNSSNKRTRRRIWILSRRENKTMHFLHKYGNNTPISARLDTCKVRGRQKRSGIQAYVTICSWRWRSFDELRRLALHSRKQTTSRNYKKKIKSVEDFLQQQQRKWKVFVSRKENYVIINCFLPMRA